jgi:hypothetical protein
VIKPTIENGFNFHTLQWTAKTLRAKKKHSRRRDS